MKKNLLKFYIVALYLCSTFVMFAAGPGDEDNNGDLEGSGDQTSADANDLPINKYILILAILGIIYVFMKYRAIQNRKVNS